MCNVVCPQRVLVIFAVSDVGIPVDEDGLVGVLHGVCRDRCADVLFDSPFRGARPALATRPIEERTHGRHGVEVEGGGGGVVSSERRRDWTVLQRGGVESHGSIKRARKRQKGAKYLNDPPL